MHLAIARSFAGIETDYVLTSQVILNRLKHWSEIVMGARVKRGFRVANSEVTPAGLFR